MTKWQFYGAVLLLLTASAWPKENSQKKGSDQAAQQQQAAQYNGGTKANPMPKSKDEADAYTAAAKLTDPTALEAAADQFASKFPDSNLRGILYQHSMILYEQMGNYDKAIEDGHKALQADPTDPVSNAELSVLLSSRTKESDLDKDERWSDAVKLANIAIENSNDVRVSAAAPPEAVNQLRNEVRGQAYLALGLVATAKKNFGDAETNFLKSAEVNAAQPDPSALIRAAVAQTQQGRLAAALVTLDRSITAATAQQQPQIAQIAQRQKEQVQKALASKQKPAGSAGTATAAPTTK